MKKHLVINIPSCHREASEIFQNHLDNGYKIISATHINDGVQYIICKKCIPERQFKSQVPKMKNPPPPPLPPKNSLSNLVDLGLPVDLPSFPKDRIG